MDHNQRNTTPSIQDFCLEEHLSRVMEIGLKTAEFATGKEIVFWSPDTLRLWSIHAGGPMLVAMDQYSEIIGFLLATFHEAGIATLENLYIAEGFRKQGIANRLLDEFEKRAVGAHMKIIRSFSHDTNAAISRLLIQRGYSGGVLTQWHVGRPQTMNLVSRRLPNEKISVRQVQPSDLDDAESVAFLNDGLIYDASCSDCVNLADWLLGTAQMMYGVFCDQRLVGLVVASIHEPTNKTTIEHILVAHSFATPSIVESLLLPLLRDLAARDVTYITAHPSIEGAGVPGLIETLVSLDFEKRRIFRVQSKVIDTPVDLRSTDHVTTLGPKDYRNLFVGSAFFSCGGGVPYEKSISLMNSSAHGMHTNLVPLDKFSPDDWLCTVYAIGASGRSQKQYSSFLLAIECLEEHLGIRIKGIVPGEIGSEVNAVWVASQRHMALVDADMVGGRAVPEEQMDTYGLNNITPTPVVVVNDQADVIMVKAAHDLSVLENVYRSFAVASGGYCYIAGRPIRQVDAKSILPCGTVSLAISTGRKILGCETEHQVIEVLRENCDSRLLARGRIVANVLKDTPGFLSGTIRIHGSATFSGKEFEIHYKNENIILFCDNECLCSVPDLISIVDAKSRMPVSNSSLQKDSDVLVFGTPALPMWQTTKGVELLGPAQFGFSHEYKPLSARYATG